MTAKMTTACRHPQLVPWFDKGETDFKRCTTCNLVLRVPMPTAAELDAIYAALYGDSQIASGQTNQESGTYALQQYAQFLLSQVLRPGQRVLDYGCGSGALVQMLRQSQVDAIGLETSAGARQFCLERRGFTLQGSLDEIPAGSVDVITMIEVIEHLTDPHDALLQLSTRLKPGGQLLVTTPNRSGLRARIDGGLWREAAKKFHVVLFDDQSLEHLLLGTGYASARHLRWSPVQRAGAGRWALSRTLQALGLAGTLCYLATRPA